jgi:TolB protein
MNDDRNRIYLARSDGSLSDQLTISQVVTAGNPGWSPDGKRIAFTCSSNGSSTDLCVIDRSGNGFARLTINMRVAGGRPAWRPDGTSIAFSAYFPVQPVIFLLDVATGAVTRVTNGSQPAWSRDGSQLAISGVGIPGLYTVTADGSFVASLRIGAYGAPAWRP